MERRLSVQRTIRIIAIMGIVLLTIADAAFLVSLAAWLLELMALQRQRVWFMVVLLALPVSWELAALIFLTNIPQTEQRLTAWGFAVLFGGLCLEAGALVTLIAAFRAPIPKSVMAA